MQGGKKYTLYIDESGTPSIEKRKGKKYSNSQKFLVLSGILVENSCDTEMSAYMSHIKRRYQLFEGESFHAAKFFEGRRKREKKQDIPPKAKPISATKAMKVSSSIAEFLATFPIKMKIVALNKKELRKNLEVPENYTFKGSKDHKEDREVGYEVLVRGLFFWFARFLKAKRAMGRIVAESRQHPDLIVFKTYLSSREANTFNDKKLLSKWAEVMNKHITAIGFENKKGLQSGLEIADITSYLAHLHLRGEMNNFKHRGTAVIWKVLNKKMENKKIDLIQGSGFNRVAPDRIHKIATKIKERVESVYNT